MADRQKEFRIVELTALFLIAAASLLYEVSLLKFVAFSVGVIMPTWSLAPPCSVLDERCYSYPLAIPSENSSGQVPFFKRLFLAV